MKKIQAISLATGFLCYVLIVSEVFFTVYPNAMNKASIELSHRLFFISFPLVSFLSLWLMARPRKTVTYLLIPAVLVTLTYLYINRSYDSLYDSLYDLTTVKDWTLSISTAYFGLFIWVITAVASGMDFILTKRGARDFHSVSGEK